jgi:hypothetical protein
MSEDKKKPKYQQPVMPPTRPADIVKTGSKKLPAKKSK